MSSTDEIYAALRRAPAETHPTPGLKQAHAVDEDDVLFSAILTPTGELQLACLGYDRGAPAVYWPTLAEIPEGLGWVPGRELLVKWSHRHSPRRGMSD